MLFRTYLMEKILKFREEFKDFVAFDKGKTEWERFTNFVLKEKFFAGNHTGLMAWWRNLQAMFGHVLPIVHNSCYNWRLQPTLCIRFLTKQSW